MWWWWVRPIWSPTKVRRWLRLRFTRLRFCWSEQRIGIGLSIWARRITLSCHKMVKFYAFHGLVFWLLECRNVCSCFGNFQWELDNRSSYWCWIYSFFSNGNCRKDVDLIALCLIFIFIDLVKCVNVRLITQIPFVTSNLLLYLHLISNWVCGIYKFFNLLDLYILDRNMSFNYSLFHNKHAKMMIFSFFFIFCILHNGRSFANNERFMVDNCLLFMTDQKVFEKLI